MCKDMIVFYGPTNLRIDCNCSVRRLISCHLYLFSCREGLLPSLLPQVGMEFSTTDEAWMFWISYGVTKALR